jgi:outer membrane protein TolC
MAIDEERSAAFAFNTIRGNPQPHVAEELTKLTPELLGNLQVPKRTSDREDVKAAEKASQLGELVADLSNAKYQPSIDIFAAGTLNGRDAESSSKANSNALKAKHPTYALGLKVSAVLGGESFSRLRAGVSREREASTLTAARRRYENDREWVDLNLKLQESRSRLGLTQKIENTQLKKLNAERNRQSRGRSTMFQVMQAETDYASAQLNVIRNKAEILGILARIKTFGGEG